MPTEHPPTPELPQEIREQLVQRVEWLIGRLDAAALPEHDLPHAWGVFAEQEMLTVLEAAYRLGLSASPPHDCEAWGMEGLGCAHCNPAAQSSRDGRHSLLARAEKAEAEVARLTEERDVALARERALAVTRETFEAACVERVEAKEAEETRLRAALRKYGRHIRPCASETWDHPGWAVVTCKPCDCGLDALLSAGTSGTTQEKVTPPLGDRDATCDFFCTKPYPHDGPCGAAGTPKE